MTTTNTKTRMPDRLTTEQRRELPDTAFGIPEEREFPLIDAEHVRSAESYFRYAPNDKKTALAKRILAKAKEYGVQVGSPAVHTWAERKQ